ncbi:EsaB/YukD family protein [Streptococcus orisratti]|uniref:EsaB/YukD family protein n=1 Tax=Streptococcus orisratti TaxID=114652 RepID=UPI00036E6150|nr:EsaB/YukD family protein [Streptococcus orisratti]
MENHINVSLVFQGKPRDVRIPIKIEVRKLIKEFDKIYGNSDIRRKYQLRVVNKGLLLDEGKVLADYPVTTGDVIKVEEI